MDKYNNVINLLKDNKIIYDNYQVVNDNLVIQLSKMIQVILHKQDQMLNMYINNYHFGDVSKNDTALLFRALLKEDKVFIEFRRPRGLYVKEYFKIMNVVEYNKKKTKLLKRRGTKIYTHNELIIDLY